MELLEIQKAHLYDLKLAQKNMVLIKKMPSFLKLEK
jgi:hypothetical protein